MLKTNVACSVFSSNSQNCYHFTLTCINDFKSFVDFTKVIYYKLNIYNVRLFLWIILKST